MGWKVQKKASINQYCLDLVNHIMKDKEKMPGGWNSQRKTNNTKHNWGCIKGPIQEREIIPGGWIVKRTLMTPNMTLASLMASFRRQQ